MKKWLKAVIGTAILFPLCGCSSPTDALQMKVASKIERESFANYVTVDGVVESTEKSNHVSTDLTDLKVLEVKCEVGDMVKKGDVLCILDASSAQEELERLEKDKSQSDTLLEYKYNQCLEKIERVKTENARRLEKAQAAIDKARADYNDSVDKFNNNDSLYNQYNANAETCYANAMACEDPEEAAVLMEQYSGYMEKAATALSMREQASMSMKMYEHEISVAQDSYKDVELTNSQETAAAQNEADVCRLTGGESGDVVSKIADLKKTIRNAEVKANCDGIVTSVSAVEGLSCPNGILMEIQDCSSFRLHVTISEEDFLSVNNKMKAEFTLASNPNEKYTGVVENIIDIKTADGFDSYISIDKPDESFVLGISAKIKICTDERSDVLTVDKSAIFTNSDNKLCVYKGEPSSDGKYIAHETVIEVGLQNDEISEILSGNIKEDDVIVLDSSLCNDGDSFIPQFINEGEYDE